MLKDGLYELFYRAANSADGSFEKMLLVLRGGEVLAADPWGGLCTGRYDFVPASRNYRLNVVIRVPPGGMLVTDDEPRPDGAEIELGTELQDFDDGGTGVIQIGGRGVLLSLRFRGPLPV